MSATQKTAPSSDKMSRDPDKFRLLLLSLETDLNHRQSWKCVNENGVLVSNENLLSDCFELCHDFKLVEYLSKYLDEPRFKYWGIHKIYSSKPYTERAGVLLKKIF